MQSHKIMTRSRPFGAVPSYAWKLHNLPKPWKEVADEAWARVGRLEQQIADASPEDFYSKERLPHFTYEVFIAALKKRRSFNGRVAQYARREEAKEAA